MVIAPARRAGDPGSIPGPGENFSLKLLMIILVKLHTFQIYFVLKLIVFYASVIFPGNNCIIQMAVNIEQYTEHNSLLLTLLYNFLDIKIHLAIFTPI